MTATSPVTTAQSTLPKALDGVGCAHVGARPADRALAEPAAKGAGVLVDNLGALFAADLTLARAIDALPEELLPPLLPTRSGHWTTTLPDADGRPVYLHSRHDPVDEAKRLLAGQAPGGLSETALVVFHGAGLGYAVAEAMRQLPRESLVLLFEPNLAVLRRMLEVVPLARAIRSRRLTIVASAEKAELFKAVGPRGVMLTLPSLRLEHAPSMRLPGAATFHAQCRAHLEDLTAYARTSVNTIVINSRRTAENIIGNLDHYARSMTAERQGGLTGLQGRCTGRPGIVVAAGPSLRKNKHLLVELQRHAVIIAVQTTLKPLLELGVMPDFVTSLDYHDISARFFENLPKSLETHLVAEPKATRRVLELHPGPVSLVGNDYADSMLRELNPSVPRLPAGATVAHLAFYLAQHLGCDPILFVGQDLGFTDGLCYTPGTAYDAVWAPELSRFCTVEMKQWEQIVRERPILRRVPDVHGRPMYTEERLFTYLQQFERDFASAPQRVFDCTEGGVLKRGAPPMPLAEAAGRFCRQPVDKAPLRALGRQARELTGAGGGGVPPILPSLRERVSEAEKIRDIARQTQPLLEEIAAHLDDQPRVNRAIARIDVLRAEMNRYGPTYDLVTQFTQQSEIQRFKADLALSVEGIDPHEKQRRQVHRDIDNCRAIEAAARAFIDAVRRAAEGFAARGMT
ncbi:MAG: motility associated factor glycosyltransferase family protein [Tepidisphaerales bacterium]